MKQEGQVKRNFAGKSEAAARVGHEEQKRPRRKKMSSEEDGNSISSCGNDWRTVP